MRGLTELRLALLKSGWTQRELAERAGIAEPTVSLIAGGLLTPNVRQRLSIASALNIPEQELFHERADS